MEQAPVRFILPGPAFWREYMPFYVFSRKWGGLHIFIKKAPIPSIGAETGEIGFYDSISASLEKFIVFTVKYHFLFLNKKYYKKE